jgi:hypothetical protein
LSKAKQRRAKKDQEKLWRAGRYMEWLVDVQTHPASPELKREIDQAWQEVQRRTLRTRQSFHEFCTCVDKIQSLPEALELHFLKALKGFVEGEEGAVETILAATGLSGAYKVAQRSLHSVLLVPQSWQGIETLLKRMAQEPGIVTRKHYRELAGYLADTPLRRWFLDVGESMADFRKLNHKANLHKPVSQALLADLEEANHVVMMVGLSLPPELRRLVLLPFAFQVVLHLRQCSYTPKAHQVLGLISAVKGVFMEGCGDLLTPELRGQLLSGGERGASRLDQEQIEADFTAASFEGKLIVLRDLRRACHEAPSWGEYGDPFAPDFSSGQDGDGTDSLLLRCYKQMLKEIGRRVPDLSPREQRALIAAIDPIAAEDVSKLFLERGASQGIIDVLLQAAESECMGIRLAMVAYFAALKGRSKRLVSAAIKVLREGPIPGQDDIQWCLREYKVPVAQSPEFLRILFDRIQGNDSLTRMVGESVYQEVKSAVVFFSFMPFLENYPGRKRMPDAAMMRFPQDLIKELVYLAGQIGEPMRALERFLTVFPQGRINEELLRQWFAEIWNPAEGCTLFLANVDELVECDEGSDDLLDYIFGAGSLGGVVGPSKTLQYPRVILDFLKERADDLRTLPLETLENIVNRIYPLLQHLPEYGSLVIRTLNALNVRIAAGETQCTGLRDTLDRHLRVIAGTRSGGRKSSRGRKK